MRPMVSPRASLLVAGIVLAVSTLSSARAGQPLCPRWSAPAQVGELDIAVLMEASGIAVSADGTRLYHINDGNAPAFLVTDVAGGATRSVRVRDFTPLDVEDLSRGPCGDAQCLILADTGDNAARRAFVQLALVREEATFGEEVAPLRVVTARYPDGPYDAEAIAVHPSGDLLLATKRRVGIEGPSLLFRLRAAQLAAGGEQLFERVGEIPVPDLLGEGLRIRRVVTGMTIAPDGGTLLLLTYDGALQVALDAAQRLPGTWEAGRSHLALPIAPLVQAEAITYLPGGRSILYSTESVRGSPAPLMRQDCGD